MRIRKAEEKDIPRIMELLGQVYIDGCGVGPGRKRCYGEIDYESVDTVAVVRRNPTTN